MTRSILTQGLLLLITFSSFAQVGWNWPENEEMYAMAKEKQAYYQIQMLQKDYNGALFTLNWLYENNGNLNPSIYKDGAKSIEKILKEEADNDRKVRLQDSLLWMYDQRIKHFNNDNRVLDRKAYTAFRLYYKTPSKYSEVLKLYKEAYALNGEFVSDFNLTPYVTIASYYYKTKPSEMPIEGVLEVYDEVSVILDAKMKTGDAEKLEKERNKIDAILSSFGDIINCDFIEKNFVSKFNEDRSDIGVAKKIFSYSLKAKCLDQAYFLDAAEVVYEGAPTFALARTLGDKFFSDKQYNKSLEYYDAALKLAENNEDKSEALLGMASAYAKKGAKASAKAKAYEVANLGIKTTAAYNLIGNLYFTSYEDCRKGKSKVEDRAIFIAAYNMYKKAGNSAQMAAAKEQFPSIEEIFSENYKEGDELKIECWTSETVILERR